MITIVIWNMTKYLWGQVRQSSNHLHHLTTTIPSPIACLKKHQPVALLQVANHLKSPGTWHIFGERTLKRRTPWGNKYFLGETKHHVLYVLIFSCQTNLTSFRIIYCLQTLRFIKVKWLPQQTIQENIPKSQGTPPPTPIARHLTQSFTRRISFHTSSLSLLLHQNATKPLLGFELHGINRLKLPKCANSGSCLFADCICDVIPAQAPQCTPVALQTLGGSKGNVDKVLYHIWKWTDTTQKFHMILGMTWRDIETKWPNWFLQHSICGKGQAPCYACILHQLSSEPSQPSQPTTTAHLKNPPKL